MKLSGKTALVTGASSGMGHCFAEQLAAMGADLVICARRKERLDELAARIRESHGVEVLVIPVDLTEAGAAEKLFESTEGAGKPIEVLINNAGFAIFSPFVDIPWERTRQQIGLNVFALTELTWRFTGAMRGRGRGNILNVASFAGYTAVPNYATYAAGKAYVRNFSEALAWELRKTGVRVCSLCPGPVATEFFNVAGQTEMTPMVRAIQMQPERVARIGLKALFRGRRNLLPGPANKLSAFFMRFLPRRFLVWMTGRSLSGHRP
jgi:short-subunit dehydrogenase